MAHASRGHGGLNRSRLICASGSSPIRAWTGSRLLREIREQGYDGGYTAVTDFLREVDADAAISARNCAIVLGRQGFGSPGTSYQRAFVRPCARGETAD